MAIRPILIDAQSPFLGENCALCKEPFTPGDEIVVCPEDATRHHVPCWVANHNKCTAYGCTGSGRPITRAQVFEEVDEEEPETGEPEVIDGRPALEGVIEPRRPVYRARVDSSRRSKVRTMPSSSFGCAQGCLILAIAVAIVIIAISCFGLWAIADYIMIEVLHWDYREPISLINELLVRPAMLAAAYRLA